MRKLTTLCRALESIPGLATTPAYWELECGRDYSIVQPFLRPTDLTGTTYPCQQQCIPGCYRDIVEYDGEIVAVCYHAFFKRPDIPLTRADTVVQQLDVSAFSKALARPLGFRWSIPVERAHGAWGVGFIDQGNRIEEPVILMLHCEQERFRGALNELLAEYFGRFVLLAPTSRHKNLSVHEVFTRREISFFPLEDYIGVSDDGQFTVIRPLARLIPPPSTIKQQLNIEPGGLLQDLPRSIGTKEAVEAVVAFIRDKGLSQTEFAILAQTNERTIRKFLQRGKVRRSTFEDMAAAMHLTKEQLLHGDLAVT